MWHLMVPVMDDVTSVLLLVYASGSGQGGLWWACLCALAVAGADRLYVLLLVAALPLWLSFASTKRFCRRCYDGVTLSPAEHPGAGDVLRVLEFLPLGQRVDRESPGRSVFEAILWALLGSRARCSDLIPSESTRMPSLSRREPPRSEGQAGGGARVMDKLVTHHPFRLLGELLFTCPYGHRLAGDGRNASRRTEAMTRAVGETLVVDALSLALSVVTSGWDGIFTGVAGVSALFSLLELAGELQYYVNHAAIYMEEGGLVRPEEVAEPQRVQEASSIV